jgi:hypothetical protein
MIWNKLDWANYEVSSCGKVRSMYENIERTNGRNYERKSRILKPAKDKSGYLRVAFKHNGRLATFKVHRLVAEAFLGKSHLEVDHVDGNKTNNCIQNLQWVTRSENIKRAFKKGLCKSLKGTGNPSAKIDEMQALTIKTLLLAGFGPIKIARDMGISKNITKDISRNKTWTHL